MKKALRRTALGISMAAVITLTASASWLSTVNDDKTINWSADKLYTEARDSLDNSNWSQAEEYYTKLESRYPFGRYAQQAQIEMAYAYWKDGDPAQAIQACDRFLRSYPNHPASDYVLYMKALATLMRMMGSLPASRVRTSRTATRRPRVTPGIRSANSCRSTRIPVTLLRPAAV